MRKLLFTSLKDHSMAFYLQNDVLVDVYVTDDTPSCIGNIYVGKVKNIVKNIIVILHYRKYGNMAEMVELI